MKQILSVLVLLICSTALNAQTIRYVKPVASGSGNGSSWADASADLQTIINASAAGDAVWVATGTYKPTVAFYLNGDANAADREKTFYLSRNIKIYGGFVGTETALTQRPAFSINTGTVLSGDIGVANDSTDNAYHVMLIDSKTANGGINSTCVIDGLIFVRGMADDATSGSLHRRGGGLQTRADVGLLCSPTVQYCGFTANFGRSGAAFGHIEGSSGIAFKNCIFENNLSIFSGASASNLFTLPLSTPMYKRCLFRNNKSGATANGGALSFIGDTGYGVGTIDSCVFSNNSGNSGGAVYADMDITIQNSSFDNNRAAGGGAILIKNWTTNASIAPLNVNLTNLSITNNMAALYGGAVDIYIEKNNNNTINISNVNFTDNQLTDTTVCYGGAMRVITVNNSTANLTMTGNIFLRNKTTQPTTSNSIAGGALFLSGQLTSTLTNCTFNENKSRNGGVITCYSDNSKLLLNMTGCSFDKNQVKSPSSTASTKGGAIYTSAYNGGRLIANFTNNTFNDNKAKFGAAIYKETYPNSKNILSLSNTSFERDTAVTSGILYAWNNNGDDGLQVRNTIFKENVVIGNGSGSITKVSFAKTTADSIRSIVENCQFLANKAYLGAGVSFNNTKGKDSLWIRNNIFKDNTGDYATGIYAVARDSSDSYVNITNNVFSKNRARVAGGALETRVMNALPKLTCISANNTFYDNSAPLGGAIYNLIDPSAATQNATLTNTAHNSIFWNNGNAIYNLNNATTILTHSSIDDSTPNGNVVYSTGTSGNNNIDLYPAFADTTNLKGADNTWLTGDDGLSLTLTSPAINQGSNAYVTTASDCTGYTRIYDGTTDMGAYEYRSIVNTENTNEKYQLLIYPNPSASGIFNLQGKTLNNSKVIVANVLGQMTAVIIQNNQLDLSAMPSGAYFIRIEGEKNTLLVVK